MTTQHSGYFTAVNGSNQSWLLEILWNAKVALEGFNLFFDHFCLTRLIIPVKSRAWMNVFSPSDGCIVTVASVSISSTNSCFCLFSVFTKHSSLCCSSQPMTSLYHPSDILVICSSPSQTFAHCFCLSDFHWSPSKIPSQQSKLPPRTLL